MGVGAGACRSMGGPGVADMWLRADAGRCGTVRHVGTTGGLPSYTGYVKRREYVNLA
jgi:hypothetical protein